MANLLAGFVKGFAGNQVDQIQERRKLENEEKKAKMLAQLQAETQRANFLFEEGYKKSNRIDENMSEKNYETGEIKLRAQDGSELGSRKMTKAEIDAQRMSLDKGMLDIENVRSTITSRARDDARADRTSAASIAASNRVGRGEGLDGSRTGSRTASSIDIARLIENDYSDDIGYLVKNYEVSPMEITQASEAAAAASMKYAKGKGGPTRAFDLARTGFKKTLDDLAKKRKERDGVEP